MSFIEYVPNEPLALLVLQEWREQGLGVTEVTAGRFSLTLPVWRHGESQEPLVIDLGVSKSPRLYRAEVTDREVVKALWASHALELIVEPVGDVEVENDDPTARYDPRALIVESGRENLPAFARNVWLLYVTSQRLLDFAEGVAIGKPLPEVTLAAAPKFDPDAMVKAVTGLKLGLKGDR